VAQAVTNPHDATTPGCLNCHDASIYRHDCDDPADSACLRTPSTDPASLPHQGGRCRTGRTPVAAFLEDAARLDVDVAEVKRAYLPTLLPIHNGRITCRTCHLHTRKKSGDYKMLRLVKLSGDDVDWSVLCEDCHRKNF
jgi:hypothetical protein